MTFREEIEKIIEHVSPQIHDANKLEKERTDAIVMSDPQFISCFNDIMALVNTFVKTNAETQDQIKRRLLEKWKRGWRCFQDDRICDLVVCFLAYAKSVEEKVDLDEVFSDSTKEIFKRLIRTGSNT